MQSALTKYLPRGQSKLTIKPMSKRAVAIAATGLLAAGLAACSSSSSTTSAPGASSSATSSSNSSSPATAAGKTLVMESSPENSITQNFNPFVSTAAAQGMGATGLIYEPLYQFDLANPDRKSVV